MIDPNNVPEVAPGETLARYILQRSHVRPGNLSVKPDAFMPPPSLELSVTRHLSATEEELWSIGEDVAAKRCRTLYGRGDIQTVACLHLKLVVKAAPLVIPPNPNHAHILGWPTEKSAQKNVAQQIAADAAFVPKP